MTAESRTVPYAERPANELVKLLERSFEQSDGVLAGVPHALCEEALLEPLREFLTRPGKRFRARLVELGFRLAGGAKGQLPRELPLVVESLHAGSLIVDDIEDESELRRAAPCLHRAIGVPLALNAGNFLYFWPQVLLSQSGLPGSVRLRGHERVSSCLMRCHQGQALDLSVRVDELEQADVARVVMAIGTLKTGGLLGLATALGALAAGADEALVEALASFGSSIGSGLQMLDDASGIQNPRRRAKAHEDLRHARATFVWAWLADDLDCAPYEQLRRELGVVRERGAPEALIERLRFRLGAIGTRRVRAHFAAAIERVSVAIDRADPLSDFAEELERLERSYVEP